MACVAILTLATYSLSADESTAPVAGPEKTYTGTVEAVHANEQMLRVKGWLLNKDFKIGNACTFALWDKSEGALAGLRAGERVTVSYQSSNGVLVADRVKQDMSIREGMVMAIGANLITVQDLGMNRTYKIADDCNVVLRGNHSGFISDVQPGNRVTIIYDTPDNQATAVQIEQTSSEFTGTLTAIDLDAKTLKAKSMFATKEFMVGSQCAIVLNGKIGGQLSDLTPNEKLVLNYDVVDGVNIVNRIATERTGQSETTMTNP